MSLYTLIFFSGAIIAVVLMLVIRSRFKKKSLELAERIISCTPFFIHKGNFTLSDALEVTNKNRFENIEADLNGCFKDRMISSSDENDFSNYYLEIYQEASSLLKNLERLHIAPSQAVVEFVNDYTNIHYFIEKHNNRICEGLLNCHKSFFDHCLKYPLDKQQRRSIVSEAENCLVVSSAGSGKTSSIVGKVKYLIEIKKINPQNILLISYTNKAAAELTERLGISGLRGYTFHKLAIDMIGHYTGEKPSICDNTDALFVKICHELFASKKFKKNVIKYMVDYQRQDTEEESLIDEKRKQLKEQKSIRLKTLLPDMDGHDIYVRSEQERKICFALSSLGVRFRYEEPYEFQVADEMHSQYRPDFSIYYMDNGETQRVYLEHFGVDDQGLVPSWFADDQGITYEEANQKYNDGITWKKAAHKKFGTKLIVTSSADFNNRDIREKLKMLLRNAGVPIEEKTEDELYDMVLPPKSRQELAFVRLIVTFITLVKSSCKSIREVLKEAKEADDERSVFLIKNIFLPVHEKYVEELKRMGQIDFTDAILQATDICIQAHPVKYDYIIVDEFQDISVDRYKFLIALREGNPPAKLYCVGDDWQSIYRFSGSDMMLFSQFADFFGSTEINKIETTYRFGEPLVSMSSRFIQCNRAQIKKNIHAFSPHVVTNIQFHAYCKTDYNDIIRQLVAKIPMDKSVFLLGRYSFDDYYLSLEFQSVKEGNKFFYYIGGRKIEFLTVHKSKGLEADFVILLQCNKDTYGFPSLVNDDPVLNYVLTESDQYPFGEERRLFYVAITRAKMQTYVLYNKQTPSVFVDEFIHPERVSAIIAPKHPNANKVWTRSEDRKLLGMKKDGKSIKEMAHAMGRSQTSIVMRLGKLESKKKK